MALVPDVIIIIILNARLQASWAGWPVYNRTSDSVAHFRNPDQDQYLYSSHGTRWVIGPGMPGVDDGPAQWLSAEQILRRDIATLNHIPAGVTVQPATRIPHGCPADVARHSWQTPPDCCDKPVLCGGGTAYARRVGTFTKDTVRGHHGLPVFHNRFGFILHYSPRLAAWLVSRQLPNANTSVLDAANKPDKAFTNDSGVIRSMLDMLSLGTFYRTDVGYHSRPLVLRIRSCWGGRGFFLFS